MLSTQYPSQNSKTGPIATTYRAGNKNRFGTCPATCNLCDKPENATTKIDWQYMQTVYDSVPNGGLAFTYSHFAFRRWFRRFKATAGKTVINYSADTLRQALTALQAGVPTVVALTPDQYEKARADGKPIKVCPADKEKGRNCANCGGSKGPICAWIDRSFIVAFLVHGTSAAKAAAADPGGCYAESGFYTRTHWRKLSERVTNVTDSEALKAFVAKLPFGASLRHHIAGDGGKES